MPCNVSLQRACGFRGYIIAEVMDESFDNRVDLGWCDRVNGFFSEAAPRDQQGKKTANKDFHAVQMQWPVTSAHSPAFKLLQKAHHSSLLKSCDVAPCAGCSLRHRGFE